MSAVLPSPAPSDEPSPILDNHSINGSRNNDQREMPNGGVQRVQNMENTRPSQYQQNIPSQAGSHPRPNSAAQTQPDFSPQRPDAQPRRQTVPTRVLETLSARAAPNTPPLPSSVLLPSDRQHVEQLSLEAQSPTQMQSPGLPQYHELPARPSSMPRPAAVQTQAQTPRGHMRAVQSPRQLQGQLPSPVQYHTSSPRTADFALPSSTLQNEVRAYSNIGPSPPNQQRRVRISTPTMPSLKSRVALIDSHIESVGGLMNLNTGLERPRFQLLKDACNNEDSFYVALHQIFCIWDTDPNEITSIQGFPVIEALQLAFKILGQLIRDNKPLAPNHKNFFCKFPSPLSNLLGSSEPYRRVVNDVGIFLARLATDWAPLARECSTRGYPPLVDELVRRLGILSPILQGVVFTASRRNLGFNDEAIGFRMEEIFKRDRQEHQALSARVNTGRPPTEREVNERNNLLATEYRNVQFHMMQRRPSIQASASAVGSPLTHLPIPAVPSNGQFQAATGSPVAMSQQYDANQARQQTLSSPGIAGNAEFANQQQQQAQMTTSGSPNPATLSMAGRPPSVAGQRVYQDTPSPTVFQGLAINSPSQPNSQFAPALRSNTDQMQSPQNLPGSIPANPNGVVYQNPEQNPEQNPMFQQYSHQQQQHQQQAAARHQQQMAAQQHQWQQNQNASQQQALMLQQHQQLQVQQVIAMNRGATQLRRDANPQAEAQRVQSRNNNLSAGGPHTPSGSNPNMPSSRGAPPSMQGSRINAVNPGQIQLYASTPPLQRPLVPPQGFVHQSQPIDPDVTALHQAHLRSPRLVAADKFPDNMAPDDPSRRFYQAVKGFTLGPRKLLPTNAVTNFQVSIGAAEYGLIVYDWSPGKGQVDERKFTTGNLQYRLRCVKKRKDDTKCLEADWVIADTEWPEHASLKINEIQLEIRRKNQHGKDLPIDITRYIRVAGPNSTSVITISIPGHRKKFKENSYFVAVEAIEFLNHNQIMNNCLLYQRKPADETLNAIKRSLAGPADDDDDDIAMVVSDLSIDLADPFTARIFEIPVRGSSCLHRECFDLKTFLLTRNSKPKRPNQASMVDIWKCPLCSKDARPYSLQIDDFLAGVRDELMKKNQLDVKAIWIAADGSWRPKEVPRPANGKRKATEEASGDDDSESDEERAMKKSILGGNKKQKSVEVEVIELDDD